MTLPFMVYLIGIISPLKLFLALLIAALSISIVLYLLANLVSYETLKQCNVKFLSYCIVSTLFLGLIQVFIPTEKTAYVIAGAYAAQKIYESPESVKIQEKVLIVINQKLDDMISDKK